MGQKYRSQSGIYGDHLAGGQYHGNAPLTCGAWGHFQADSIRTEIE